jgi:3',5'-cyclic AMP phosphodiesterase CpdA
MNRSKPIQVIGIICLIVLFSSIYLLSSDRSEVPVSDVPDLTIMIATDLHYIAPELTDNGEYFSRINDEGDGKVSLYISEITEAFVEQAIEEHPDALVVTGDLTFNGARTSHRRLAEMLESIRNAGIPVLVLPGNHDLYNRMAASFSKNSHAPAETIDADAFASIYARLGYDDASARDKSSLSYVYALDPNVRILMIDANTAQAPGTVTDATLAWAERQLAAASEDGALVIAASHQPILNHNDLFHDRYAMGNNERLLALYEQYNVACNLGGHMHFQHIASDGPHFCEILTEALAVTPNQYGILEIGDGMATYRTEPTDLSSVPFPETTDGPYPSSYFRTLSFRKAMEQLEGKQDAYGMATYFADVNTAYFTGTLDSIDWDDPNFALWNQESSFLSIYLGSIRKDGSANFNQSEFPLP